MNIEWIKSLWREYPVLPALIAGVAVGVGSWLLKLLLNGCAQLAYLGYHGRGLNWWLAALGVLSIVLTGLIVRKVVRLPLEHSTDKLKADLAAGKPFMPKRLMVAPIATSAMTLGFGGSAGAEGPIAYSGAAIATNLGRWCGLTQHQLLVFMTCGAGAGIAAIFKAPLGGIFFSIEVLKFGLAIPELLLLTIMCLTAGLTAYAIGGGHADLVFTAAAPFEVDYYIVLVALGIWCGIYSLYYHATGLFTDAKLSAIKKPWLRNVIAGTILGVLLFMFPCLYGEGYGVLDVVLNGDIARVTQGTFAGGSSGPGLVVSVLIGILLVKGIITYATNSGGGVAGEFAPTIFAGGMAGALFIMLIHAVPGLENIPAGDIIMLAMAGVMAGVIEAPFMAIFIVVEMTQCQVLLLPVCVVSGISYFIKKAAKLPKLKL